MSNIKQDTKLTIGIPTFNGSKYIREALDSMVAQFDEIDRKQLEILISDNASTDDTQEIIKEYLDKYPEIFSYYKNQENVGFDRNVDLLFKRARGKYVWIFGDDDIIHENSLKKVLNFLDKDLIFVHLNWSSCSSDLKILEEQTLKINEDTFCHNISDFIKIVKINPVLVSSNIFNKNCWLEEADIFIETGWIHYAKLLQTFKRSGDYLATFESFVKYRGQTAGYKDDYLINLKLGLQLFKILSFYKKDIDLYVLIWLQKDV